MIPTATSIRFSDMEVTYEDFMADLTSRLVTAIGVKKEEQEVLTIQECAKLTNLSVHYIYTLTSSKDIPHSKRAGKLYFKREDIIRWLTEKRVKTNEEVSREAESLLFKRKNK